MHITQSNISKMSFLLALAINKKVVKAEIGFLALNNCWHNNLFLNSYIT